MILGGEGYRNIKRGINKVTRRMNVERKTHKKIRDDGSAEKKEIKPKRKAMN